VLNAIISFVLISVGVYFFIVLPINHLSERRKRSRGVPAEAVEPTELELLTQIRDALIARR
jgi:large conductance mechanosensitive channel